MTSHWFTKYGYTSPFITKKNPLNNSKDKNKQLAALVVNDLIRPILLEKQVLMFIMNNTFLSNSIFIRCIVVILYFSQHLKEIFRKL